MKKSKSSKTATKSNSAKKSADDDFLIVGIGASAGGVQALKTFFENVPADSGAAYVVILHLSPNYDSQLAQVLQTVAPIKVTQVTEKVKVEPNHVYVVPPNESLSMSDGHIIVSPVQTFEERRAPVDIFFRTLAESHHAHAVAVVLSGTGADGSMGLKRVKENGGAAFVQNPREAEFGEMPRHSIATALIDEILNVSEIPQKIAAYQKNFGKVVIPGELEVKHEEQQQQQALREIFTLLRVRAGHDFSNYKRPTVLRRIVRRVNVHNLSGLPEYADFLKKNQDETKALLKDLLISVTNFFRDNEAFLYLENEVLPHLLRDKKSGDQIRLWVAGCATGEEAYSLAMLLAEKLSGSIDPPRVQIFATDIDEDAIATARNGFYTLNDAADVSPERLHRFFIKEKKGYRIRRELREMILFANHNLLKDPPFSQLDLVTCRNLLIYFNRTAQERVMETFHFALKSGSYLFLGSSESIDNTSDLYHIVNREQRIYQSRTLPPRVSYPVPDLSPSLRYDQPPVINASFDAPKKESRQFERISYGDLHGRILEQFAPPSIIVNEQYDIVHVSPQAGRYLRVSGELTANLFKIVRPELRAAVTTAVYQAVQRQTNVETGNLKLKDEGDDDQTVKISVRPAMQQTDETTRGFILIIFEQLSDALEQAEAVFTSNEPITRQLEEALTRSQNEFRHSIEMSEVQAEELKASNEELQAMNEELRSTTEELETGKEELQSVNEELITVNQELKIKIEELSQSNSDFQNLINSTIIGTIFLDRDFRVKMFTPAASEIFNLITADTGRLLSDITHKLEYEDLIFDIEQVLSSLQPVEREVRTQNGGIYLMQITPYRISDDRIGGTILAFVNITERKRVENESRENREHLQMAMKAGQIFSWELNLETREFSFSENMEAVLGFGLPTQIIQNPFESNMHPEDAELAVEKTLRAVETGAPYENTGRFVNPQTGEIIWLHSQGGLMTTAGGRRVFAGIAQNITERKQAEEALRESERKYRTLFESIDEGFYLAEIIWDENGKAADIRYLDENPAAVRMINQSIKGRLMSEINPDYEQNWRDTFGHTARTGEAQRQENYAAPLDIWFDFYVFKPQGTTDDHTFALVFQNITERKRQEEQLRASEEHARLMVEGAFDFAIFRVSSEKLIQSWNTGAERVFGWNESEIIGQPTDTLFTLEDRKKGVPKKELETARANGRAEDERWHVRKDGTRFFASGVMMRLKESADGFVKIARDQTNKIQAQKAERDREMLQKLVKMQEDERKRIARDLHDELGQQLVALRLKLEAVRSLCKVEKICSGIDEAQILAKHIDYGVDFLAWELRPAALDDLGLNAALKKYVSEWSRFAGVTSEFRTLSLKKARLAPEVETNLYRITQEALNNTHKHAKAGRAEVSLEKHDGHIILTIEDDGKGFSLRNKKNKNDGIGLIGMRERAALIGGTFEIESAPKKGTTIFVRVPATFAKKQI